MIPNTMEMLCKLLSAHGKFKLCAFWNFLNFSFFKNTLDGLLVDPAAEPVDMRPDWLCLPYSLR